MTDSTSKLEINIPVSSKKSKLFPRPELEPDDGIVISHTKRKTDQSSHNTKVSTTKKLEVTFSEDVAEIENKENDIVNLNESSPSHISPSKHSLKSVKEHIKTPFSKVKEGEEEGTPLNKSLVKNVVSGKKFDPCSQPDFSAEIDAIKSVKKENTSPLFKSAIKSAIKPTIAECDDADKETVEKKTVYFSEVLPEEKCISKEDVQGDASSTKNADNTESQKAEN
jgi:hypothetical protein